MINRIYLSCINRSNFKYYKLQASNKTLCKLLDVGCGLTDLYTFLTENKFDLQYFGVDICEAILDEARRQWPNRSVSCTDVFEGQYANIDEFDVVYCSGVFNLDLGNNLEFIEGAIPRLIDISSHLVIANFLHKHTRKHYAHCF